MNLRLTGLFACTLLACSLATEATVIAQVPRAIIPKGGKVQPLHQLPLTAKQWRNVGYNSPQDSLQTFLWAVRERDVEVIKTSFNSTEIDIKQLEAMRAAVTAFRPLAIRRIDDSAVDLTYELCNWKPAPLVQRFKKDEVGWRPIRTKLPSM